MIAESGLQPSPSLGDVTFETVVTGANEGAVAFSASSYGRSSTADTSSKGDVAEAVDELPDVMQLNTKIAEVEAAIRQARKNGETKKVKELSTRREDLVRLKRVEQIYVRPRIGSSFLLQN